MGKEEDNNNRDNESKFNGKYGALNDVTCTSIKNNNHSWQKMLQEEEELIDGKQKEEKKVIFIRKCLYFYWTSFRNEIIIIFPAKTVKSLNQTRH